MPLKNYNLISGPQLISLSLSILYWEVLCKEELYAVTVVYQSCSCDQQTEKGHFCYKQSCTNLFDMNVNSRWKKKKNKNSFLKKKKEENLVSLFCPPSVFGESADRRSNLSKQNTQLVTIKMHHRVKSKKKNLNDLLVLKPCPPLPLPRKAQDGNIAASQKVPWFVGNTIFFKGRTTRSTEDNTLSCHWLNYFFIAPPPVTPIKWTQSRHTRKENDNKKHASSPDDFQPWWWLLRVTGSCHGS